MATEQTSDVQLKQAKAKVALLGDGAVGKTSLFRRFTENQYSEEYLQTIGTSVSVKSIHVPHQSEIIDLKLQVWDIMGQGRFERLVASSLIGTKGLFLVCDVTRPDTIVDLSDWAAKAGEVLDDPPFIVIANKMDIAPPDGEYMHDLWALVGELDAPVLFTSAKAGTGVEEAFGVMGRYIVTEVDQHRALPKERRVDRVIDPVVLALDHLISQYCQLNGGVEEAMPWVQECFAKIQGDINDPTPAMVRDFLDRLAPLDQGPPGQPDPALVYRGVLNMLGPTLDSVPIFTVPKRDLTPVRVVAMNLGELLYECQVRKLATKGSPADLRERLLEAVG